MYTRDSRMDLAQKPEYSKLLLSFIPESGESIGNVSLRDRLKRSIAGNGDELTDQDYWSLRDGLIDEGLIEQGRGRGGSVRRSVLIASTSSPPTAPEIAAAKTAEVSLYDPIHAAITSGYVKENRIKRFVSELTAAQGRRATGGKWTRPDLTIVAVRTYRFTPGKRLEVITFEVKPSLDTAIEGVYEALAHSAFAHRTYLVVDCRQYGEDGNIPDERIIQECSRHGVGYITFDDPSDYGTFTIQVSARLKEADPYEVDNFISTQLSPENQDQLRDFLS